MMVTFNLARDIRKALGRRSRNRFREIEECDVFTLAEILRLKELRQADDLGAFAGGGAHAFDRRSRFCSGWGEQDICTRPMVNVSWLGMGNLFKNISNVPV